MERLILKKLVEQIQPIWKKFRFYFIYYVTVHCDIIVLSSLNLDFVIFPRVNAIFSKKWWISL